MEFQTYVSWISSPVQIAFLDLVLGADNAVIIALVCRTLPRHQRLNVMIVGTGAALLLRIVLTALAGALMFAPLLRLIGGLVLVLIAVSLTDELDIGPVASADDRPDAGRPRDPTAESEMFWDAILLVVLADGIMSLDNTVALAAVAEGNLVYLILGLVLSVPTLVFGSWLLSELLGQTPFLARTAMAVLGWIAGTMAVSDPFVVDWIALNAPALNYGVPIACVILVLAKSASRPIVVPNSGDDLFGPVLPADPMVAAAIASGAQDEASMPARPIAPEVRVLEPFVPEPARAVQRVAEPLAAEERAPAASEVKPLDAASRKSGDRLVMIGLIILFSVAALLIGSAIYFGNATF